MPDRPQPAKQKTAVEASLAAQRIALAPIIFQAARLLRDTGILNALRKSRTGLTAEELAGKIDLSAYGVVVLLEAGLAAEAVRREEDRYFLTETGVFLLTDEATRINMDVVQECCYQAAYYLEDSLRRGAPVGLQKVFGDDKTIYPALPGFPEAARESWLAWDHYYSDAAFPQALPLVLESGPRTLLDVGGNTGKWAIQCVTNRDDITVTILDLPEIVALADESIRAHGLQGRITAQGVDLLDGSQPFPRGFDAIWMSQFLVCFSENEISSLLERAAAAMDANTKLYILDNFWDRQTFEVAAFCLQSFSLYFTFLANGRSRMYKASDITRLVEAAGMRVDDITDNLGICTSLVSCSRP
jgi:Dimerisation2-like domain/O-methyltransferase domain